jgi:ATP-dependent RNA circularization protein (DNA/RNA ligase family)
LFVFNVFDIDNGTYFNFAELDQFCRYYNLPMVKVIELNTSFEYKTVDELLAKSVGLYEGTNNQREGIVIRPLEETWSKVLKGRMSFKVVNNEYLLSGGDV